MKKKIAMILMLFCSLFNAQWGVKNTGQFDIGVGNDINAEPAGIFTGLGSLPLLRSGGHQMDFY